MLNRSVFGVIGTVHAAQRRLLNPLFTKEAIRGKQDILLLHFHEAAQMSCMQIHMIILSPRPLEHCHEANPPH